jgi:hypothetical protein
MLKQVILIYFLIVSLCYLNAKETINLIRNGDFSQIKDNKILDWQPFGHSAVKQKLTVFYDKGNPCAKLTCTKFERKSGSSHALIGQIGLAYPLKKGKLYELSCRMKAENILSHSVVVQIRNTKTWGNGGLNKGVTVGKDWRKYTFKFWATDNLNENSRVSAQFVETGILYLDDMKLVELPEPEIKFTNLAPETNSKNLILNGNFRVGTSTWTSCGDGMACSKLEKLHGELIGGKAPAGNSFLRIKMGGNDTPVLTFDGWGIIKKKELRPLVENMQLIRVKKDQKYTFSCYMRAKNKNTRAALQVVEYYPAFHGSRDKIERISKNFYVDENWKKYQLTFIPKSQYVTIGAGPDLKKDQETYIDINGLQLEAGPKATDYQAHSAIEVAIFPSELGGVFVKGKDKTLLIVKASNNTQGKVNCKIKFDLYNYFDKKVELPMASFTLSPASSKTLNIKLPDNWKGFFAGFAKWQAANNEGSTKIRIAIVPSPPKDSILGINHPFAPDWLITQARKAGVLWFRNWVNWHQIEPKPNHYDYERLDAQVNRVVGRGAHLMSILPVYPSTDWSSERNPAIVKKGNSYLQRNYLKIQPSRDINTLTGFIKNIVSRYKDRVNTWEFLNEPVYSTTRALPRTHYKPEAYLNLLKAASVAMKKADPNCKIIGGISGSFYALPQTSELIRKGMLKYADITNLHIYPRNAPEIYLSDLEKLVSLMEEYKCLRPIWITEFAYTAFDDFKREPYIPSNTEIEIRMLPSEKISADRVLRFFAIMNAHYVKKIFFHAGITTTPNGLIGGCPIFAYGGAPTKAFAALAQYVNFIGTDFRLVAKRKIGNDVYIYALNSKGKNVAVIWNTEDSVEQYVKIDKKAEAYDAMGNKLVEGKVKIGATPVYLVSLTENPEQWIQNLKLENK